MGSSDGKATGLFITFEGGDGVGKSTHIQRLATRLRARGYEVVVTREPGGAPGAESIRELLVKGDVDRWGALSEALLMFAARAEHLRATITPALLRDAIVLCDRFSDSTMAYQGIAGGLGREAVAMLDALVVGDAGPDLTFVLHAQKGEGLARVGRRDGEETRFEDKGARFQEHVASAFQTIARENPARCILIDTSGDADDAACAIEDAFDLRCADWMARR